MICVNRFMTAYFTVAAVLLQASSALNASVEVPAYFYPFGVDAGDRIVPPNDDGGSGPIDISIPFPYFDNLHSTVYVNTNGAISFLSGLSQYVPDPFPLTNDRRLITPFWADIDTRRNPGRAYYRETQDQATLNRASGDVKATFVDQTHFQATWLFVATWYNVTYFGGSQITPTNTFQAVLITNGRHSFAQLHYGNITWTSGPSSGGIPAQAGFNAGDGIRFFNVPGSRTPAIADIEETSNVMRPGRWVFRVDEAEVVAGGCNTAGSLAVGPRFASSFGGKLVRVAGPCLNATVSGTICRFAGLEVPATILGETYASCVVPMTFKLGKSTFELSVDGGRTFNHTGVFWFVREEEEAYKVTQVDLPMWYARDLSKRLDVRWNAPTLNSPAVDVDFLTFDRDPNKGETTVKTVPLAKAVPNTGYFTLPDDLELAQTLVYALTGVIRISENGTTPNSKQSIFTEYAPAPWYLDRFLYETAKRYSTNRNSRRRRFLIEGVTDAFEAITKHVDVTIENLKDAISEKLLDISDTMIGPACDWWHDKEAGNPPDFESVLPSPCSLSQALRDPRFVADTACNMGNGCDYFHKGAYHCVRSAQPSDSGASQQACYDADGKLLGFENGGGTFDKSHTDGHDASGKWLLFDHVVDDVLPYMACCKLSHGRCDKYGDYRPTDDCEGYEEPRPAWTAGDPHIITLDGLNYTFNGVGEYVVLHNKVNGLLIQGRTEQYENRDTGETRQASVWTALAVRRDTSAVVEIRSSYRLGLDVLIDGSSEDFSDVQSLDENGVEISYIEERVRVNFGGQASIEVTQVEGSLSFFVVLSPASMGQTAGLLGVFNGNIEDDLTRPNGSAIPHDSSERDIFYNFGEFWRIEESDSLFTYRFDESYASFDGRIRNFEPRFGLPEADEETRRNAQAVCGDSRQCQYDYVLTGNEILARRTSEAQMEFLTVLDNVKPVVTCGFPTVPENGNGNVTNGPAGALVIFRCDEDYILEGSEARVCQENGQWSGEKTKCTDKDSRSVAKKHALCSILPVVMPLLGLGLTSA